MFVPPAAVPANPIAHSSQTNTIFVAGTWMNSASNRTFLVKNPATLEVIGECADGDGSAAIAALEAAYRAFDDWSRVPPEQRATRLHHLAQLVQRDQAALADLLIAESGKPRREALGEVSSSVSYLHWNAEEATRVHGRTLAAPRPSVRLWTQKQPIGVVVAITPWNYPLNTLCRKIAPALAAGCTVIAKPAPQTPLTAIAFMRLAEEAKIPAGVLNLVTTSQTEETVRVWMDDSRVRKIAFTGSTAVGVRLVKESAATLKRVSSWEVTLPHWCSTTLVWSRPPTPLFNPVFGTLDKLVSVCSASMFTSRQRSSCCMSYRGGLRGSKWETGAIHKPISDP